MELQLLSTVVVRACCIKRILWTLWLKLFSELNYIHLIWMFCHVLSWVKFDIFRPDHPVYFQEINYQHFLGNSFLSKFVICLLYKLLLFLVIKNYSNSLYLAAPQIWTSGSTRQGSLPGNSNYESFVNHIFVSIFYARIVPSYLLFCYISIQGGPELIELNNFLGKTTRSM